MKLPLHWRILIGLALGVVVGVLINAYGHHLTAAAADSPSLSWGLNFIAQLTDFVGKLFVRCLRFVAVPIVLFSLIVGAASLGDLRSLGRIGGKTLGMYLLTTAAAVVLGLVIGSVVRPGDYISAETRAGFVADRAAEVQQRQAQTEALPTIWQQALELVPVNPFASLAEAQMLQVIIFALAIGIGLALIPREKAAPTVAVFDSLTDVMIKIVHGIMWTAPVAVFALVAPVVATMGMGVITALGIYCLAVAGGLAILLFIVYPTLLLTLTRTSPARFFKAMAPAQLLAVSSSSSVATLPVTMACVRERLGVSERITSFVCPLGATVNMDGTALMQAVATVFVAQMYGMDLTVSQQAGIVLLATLSSIGSPGIPSGGIVMLVVVLQSVGLPIEGIAVILAVDRVLDMLRTVINISGDAMTAVVVAHTEGELSPPTDVVSQ